MARSPTTERLRITPSSALRAVGMLGATLVVLRILAASTRVLGWLAAAVVIAGLLHPLVTGLSRRIPRALAVLLVLLAVLGAAGLVGYSVVDTIVSETRNVQETAPDAARRLERSDRWGDLATDFHLAERTETFVDEIPERLRGGTPAEAVRSAATRGVAFLATAVLSIFFLVHGPRLVQGALNQIGNPERRARVDAVASRSYVRAVRYLLSTILLAVAAGLFGYLVASLADVSGAAAFGLWVALWDVVPIIGALVGALPIVILAAVFFSVQRAVAVALAFLAWQAFEHVVVQRRIERRSVHLGPFVTLFAGLIGLELYGLGGALLGVVVATSLVAVGDEALPR